MSPRPRKRSRPNRSGRGCRRGRPEVPQAKAEAAAEAAEQARIAAEKTKQVAQEQAAEAERNVLRPKSPLPG